LKKELERLMKENEKAAQQRILLQHGRRDVAEVTVVNTMAIGPFLFLMIFRKGFENK